MQHITSSDPMVEPGFDPHYFEHEVDLDVLVETAKFSRSIVQHAPLRDMIAREVVPGPDVQTDEQLKSFVKNTYSTTWHTCGTCSMMPRDKGGVVGHDLKVYGTNNLRVVDLSVAPLHIAAHVQGGWGELSPRACTD
ncbi:uncharacterized protein PHACADRAFT_146426 [Phanerochaete carnosa HHB-10118-sp]|uniref:Glucose-methanol-choline oxidoreductase C-terminal domain-containing protein n=1 Tax=Phanerochaete carnosa (strain HHB-10118-sp) TaxID=650164 RepID=K5W5P6_PHACS|nr:uncharacterized protein PHACADRAFT_146426 [Phanerochaete carnosa HHB-10118-sp]EKM54465.1 hypothetical protein PHACADRAFT_146426 [Phanerochaete carnosa HHB-10118-sp]